MKVHDCITKIITAILLLLIMHRCCTKSPSEQPVFRLDWLASCDVGYLLRGSKDKQDSTAHVDLWIDWMNRYPCSTNADLPVDTTHTTDWFSLRLIHCPNLHSDRLCALLLTELALCEPGNQSIVVFSVHHQVVVAWGDSTGGVFFLFPESDLSSGTHWEGMECVGSLETGLGHTSTLPHSHTLTIDTVIQTH